LAGIRLASLRTLPTSTATGAAIQAPVRQPVLVHPFNWKKVFTAAARCFGVWVGKTQTWL
jgi:hypothetical protein